MKNTKKALLTSALCLLLCMSMLIGTTFAWFTDSVSTTNNIIKAGNLDVNLEWSTDGNTWTPVDANTNIFKTGTLWEPGHTEVVYLKVVNKGTLALKYTLDVNVDSEIEGINVANETFKLSDHILYNVFEGVETYEDSADARGDETGKKLNVPYNKAAQLLETEEEHILTMVVFMPTTVGNEANYKTGTTAPSINLGISLFATQYTHEEDGFDKYYDGAIAWNGGVDISWYDPAATEMTIGSAEQLAGLAAITNGTATAPVVTYAAGEAAVISDNFAGKTIKLASNIDLNNLPWTPIADGNADGYVGFAGTFDGQGYTINNLNVSSEGWAIGLFGYLTEDVTIKNVTVNNANVNSGDEIAGVVVAYTMKGTFENVHVTGNVNVKAMSNVGGIVGYGKATTFSDCSVVANAGSTITATTGSYAGGIVGDHGEGTANNIYNCAVENLTITGYAGVGGIAGKIGYGNTVDSCSVKNVTLNKTRIDGYPSIGIISGVWGYNANSAITITNNSAVDVTLNGTSVAYEAYNVLYGSEYYGKTTTNFVLDNNTVEYTNKVESIIAANPSNVQSVIDAAAAGDVITLVPGEYHTTIVMKSGITLKGSEGAVVDCIALNAASDVTLENIDFDAAGAQISYDNKGTAKIRANIVSWNAKGTAYKANNVKIVGCTFTGAFANGGAAIAFTDQNRGGNANVTIQDCIFDTTNGTYDIYGHYFGGGALVIEGNTFASVSNYPEYPTCIYLGRYQSSTPVEVKGNTFENKASFDAAAYIQDHSDYGVSFDVADNNIFNG